MHRKSYWDWEEVGRRGEGGAAHGARKRREIKRRGLEKLERLTWVVWRCGTVR